MEWEFIIKLTLGIIGAALVAGGVIGYQRSERSGVKALSAAAAAAGMVMWVAIIFTTPVSVSGTGPEPTVHYMPSGAVGVLEGNVTIGPVWPVERSEGNPPIPPEVYEARKIFIYDAREASLIVQLDIVPNGDHGTYRVELTPGSYLVDINHVGIDSSSDVPIVVEIVQGETVTLDIDIDTGIR